VRPLLPTGLLPDGTKGEQGMARWPWQITEALSLDRRPTTYRR
jgi:hypothetical protein